MRALMWALAMWALGLLLWPLAVVERARRRVQTWRDTCEIEWLIALAQARIAQAKRRQS